MIPALVTRGGVGFRLADLFPERHGFTIMAGSGRPLSRGHILLHSADPTAHPRIFPEYFRSTARATAATAVNEAGGVQCVAHERRFHPDRRNLATYLVE